jgi:hypothetical protein
MPRQPAHAKTCHRCGRRGSHAFRRTADGLWECTTATACRVRARRQAGARQDGRGRLPTRRSLNGSEPGVVYVIGHSGPERDLVERTLREELGMTVSGDVASKATLSALGSRNVRLIAVSAGALESVGFRNEFALRCHQPRLGSVPVLVYGVDPAAEAAAARMPGLVPVGHAGSIADLRARLRARIRTIDGAASAASAADDSTLTAL